jgi:hypothetical protein
LIANVNSEARGEEMSSISLSPVFGLLLRRLGVGSPTVWPVLGALFVLGALQAGATTIPYKSFADLVRESDAVVSARVANIESKYDKEKEIFTFVTLDQIETLSGSYAAPTLTLRFRGGEVENDVLHIAGSPKFEPNENVIVFVHGNGRYMVPVVGWTQGVFRISRDAATGREVVTDHERNSVFGIQNGMLMKEQKHLPEAEIIGQRQAPGASAMSEAGAGTVDYHAPATPGGTDFALAPGTAIRTPIAGPPMAVAAFVNAIKSSPRATNPVAIRSVGPNDVDSPSDNRDALTAGSGPAPAAPAERKDPVLPQRQAPAPIVNDQP